MALLILYLSSVILALVLGDSCSTSKWDKYCGYIRWQGPQPGVDDPYADDVMIITDEAFNQELANNDPLGIAYNETKMKRSDDIDKLVEDYADIPLSRREVILLMAYTYQHCHQGVFQFYLDLYLDSRNFGLKRGRYPVTNTIIRNALIGVWKGRKSTWIEKYGAPTLYRSEPRMSRTKYQNELTHNQTLMLSQFVSVSTIKDTYPCGSTNVISTELPHATISVPLRDFSWFPDDEEVILIPWYGQVKVKAIDDDSVQLDGPNWVSFSGADPVVSAVSQLLMLLCVMTGFQDVM